MRNLNDFLQKYPASGTADHNFKSLNGLSEDLNRFLHSYCGVSFGRNIFRILRYQEITHLDELMSNLLGTASGEIIWFSANWMGNIFGQKTSDQGTDQKFIAMFDFGGAELFDVGTNFDQCLGNMVEYPDEDNGYFNPSFFKLWSEIASEQLDTFKCVGYKVPLFLGGVDDETNLEVIDTSVYWELTSQIIKQSGKRILE